jgi:SAM-dependent methyltransferase
VNAAAMAPPISAAKRLCRQFFRSLIPLAVRKRLAIGLQRWTWVNAQRRHWWSVELVRDLADKDVDAFHEFLWTHHLGYAATYEIAERFGAENIKLSRRLFFADLRQALSDRGVVAERDVRSVFEVGCSLGYQLRYMETDLFPRADRLEGVDIDRYAIEAGSQFLRAEKSRIALHHGDMRDLERILSSTTFDVIACAGVLMYLTQEAATEVVGVMLRRTKFLAVAALAHPSVDNKQLTRSETRSSDSTFVHNIDAMVAAQGGRVVARRWEGGRDFEGNTVYFVFAEHA